MKATFLVGTRPEILKMYPIVLAAQRFGLRFSIIHSGQHYDYRLSEIFFRELRLPRPDLHLGVGSGTHSHQIAQTLLGLERIMRRMPIKDLLVVGDTNTVVSGAIFAKRNGVHLFHVEAGARCYDPTMPEEQNRRVADHLSDVLFAPTQWNKDTLRAEGIHAGVHVTGNSIIDGCVRVLARLPHQPPILNKIPYEEFALVTAHRPEIVDNPVRLSELIKICDGLPFPAVFPCHPRTRNRIRSFGLMKRLQDPDRILLLPPLGYTDFLALMKRSQFVVTDSGGVTEEATAPGFDKLVFSPREFTELPEAVQSGHLTVVGPHHLNALKAIQRRLDLHHRPHGHPYGRGRSGERIAKLIREHLSA